MHPIRDNETSEALFYSTSSRHSVSWGAAQKTACEKIKKETRLTKCLEEALF